MNKLGSSQMVDRNVELAKEILRLKHQRSAIILAHNYQRGEVQDTTDFICESLEF